MQRTVFVEHTQQIAKTPQGVRISVETLEEYRTIVRLHLCVDGKEFPWEADHPCDRESHTTVEYLAARARTMVDAEWQATINRARDNMLAMLDVGF